jgi:chromosome segregation ATPase
MQGYLKAVADGRRVGGKEIKMEENKLESIIFGLKETLAEKDKEIERLKIQKDKEQLYKDEFQDKCVVLKLENAELQKQVDELNKPIGKFRNTTALQKAYESLEKEFTKRSQQLKELQRNNDALVEDLANMTIYPEEAVKRIRDRAVKYTVKDILILAEDYNYGYEDNMDDFMQALKEKYGVEVE